MIIKQVLSYMVIVSFPAINPLDVKLNNFDYTIDPQPCYKNTMEFNYIRSDEYILENIQKYQDLNITIRRQSRD